MSSTFLAPVSVYNPPSQNTLDILGREYFREMRCAVNIYDSQDPNVLIHKFDSFRSEQDSNYNTMVLTLCDATVGMSSTGSFTLQIDDPERNIDTSILHENCSVQVAAGKHIDNYKNLIFGFIDTFTPIRKATGRVAYQFTGLGSAAILNDIIVDFVRNANLLSTDDSRPSTRDPNQRAYKLFHTLMTATDIFPLIDQPSIADRINASVAAIDKRVNDFIPGINSRFVTAATVANLIADICGAQYGIDGYNQAFFRFPTSRHSGITIKDRIEEGDHPNYVSYPKGEWRWTRSIKKSDGFANRLYAKTTTQSTNALTSQPLTKASRTLFQRDLAQQIIPGAAKFRDLALVLQKKGTGGKTFLYGTEGIHGHIIEDLAGGPFGQSVAQFNIPMSIIPDSAAGAVYTMNINYIAKAINAFGTYWIVLYAHGDDDSNTVSWFNDGTGPARSGGTVGLLSSTALTSAAALTQTEHSDLGVSAFGTGRKTPIVNAATPTTQGFDIVDLWSAERSSISQTEGGRGPDHQSTTAWYISNVGPQYSFGTFDSWSHLIVAEDSQSIEDWGLKEDVIDVSWAPSASLANKYLNELLYYRAKPRMNFQMNSVTIPAAHFVPGTLVDIIDDASGLTKDLHLTAEIQEVRYTFDAFSVSPLGARTVQVTPLAYYQKPPSTV